MTEIPTGEGRLYLLATVLDLYSRRLLACPMSDHPDAQLSGDAMTIAAAVRGGRGNIAGVVFHTDRGSTYTVWEVRQSMGRHCRRRTRRDGNLALLPPTEFEKITADQPAAA